MTSAADAGLFGAPALGIRADGLPGPMAVAVHLHDFAGTADVEIPLPLPQLRGAPSISIVHSQGAPNGPFGLGMALTVPSVDRRTDTGVPTYGDDDGFLGPGGEQLVPAAGRGAVRTYRTRTTPYEQRIERVTTPDGAGFWQVRG